MVEVVGNTKFEMRRTECPECNSILEYSTKETSITYDREYNAVRYIVCPVCFMNGLIYNIDNEFHHKNAMVDVEYD